MKLTLYTISGAPRGWRAQLALALKGLDWQTTFISGAAKEQKAEPFLRLNPRGTVPVLETGKTVIRDSFAILDWLERTFPTPVLFGATTDNAARIWELALQCEDYLRPAITDVLSTIFSLADEVPFADNIVTTLSNSSKKLHQEFNWLDDQLSQSEFLGGDTPTAADCFAYPEIRLVQRAADRQPSIMKDLDFGDISSRYTRITRWLDSLNTLPGVIDTTPLHWFE